MDSCESPVVINGKTYVERGVRILDVILHWR